MIHAFRRTQSGFGLLEMIVTFVLVLAASVVTFMMFSSAKASAAADTLNSTMHVFVANARTYLAANKGIVGSGASIFSGHPDAATLNAINVLPTNMPTTGQPVTAYGPILVDTAATPYGTAITIDFTNIPDSVCAKMVYPLYTDYPPIQISTGAKAAQVFIDGAGPTTTATPLSCDPGHAGSHDVGVYIYLSH